MLLFASTLVTLGGEIKVNFSLFAQNSLELDAEKQIEDVESHE